MNASTVSKVALTQDEAFARIRLLRSANIGPVTYAHLLHRFGTAKIGATCWGQGECRGLISAAGGIA